MMRATSTQHGVGSRSVLLRPLLPSDAEWCYLLACGPAGERWRYRGRTPSHEQVAADLWRGVYAQFVVVDRATGDRAGLVGFYNVAVDAGRAYAFALADPDRSPKVTEGFGLLCEWGFEHQGFQRIYLEVPEFNLDQFASLGDAAVVEGRLRNHEIWQGRYWDYFILVLTPESFGARFGALLQRRRATLAHVEELDVTAYSALVESSWPLDSLGLVEVADALEQVLGTTVDPSLLVSLDAADPGRWVEQSLELGDAQPLGSASSPPGEPSGPTTSSRGPRSSRTTTSGDGPEPQSTR